MVIFIEEMNIAKLMHEIALDLPIHSSRIQITSLVFNIKLQQDKQINYNVRLCQMYIGYRLYI